MSKTPEFSDNDLDMAGLTETERAALAEEVDETSGGGGGGDDGIFEEKVDDIEVPHTKAEKTDDVGDKEGEQAETDEGEKQEQETGETATEVELTPQQQADATSETKTETEQGETGTPEQETQQYQQQAYRGPDITGAQDRLNSINEELINLGEKLDNGEITGKEFQQENVRLQNERSRVERDITKAEMAAESAEETWENEQRAFFNNTANTPYTESAALHAALDAEVKRVANDAAFSGKTGREVLAEADRRVRAVMRVGNDTAPAPAKDDKASTAAKDELARRKQQADKNKAPVTLGDIPPADETKIDGGEFAHLDSLDGMEYEQAFARLTPEQQNRYLKAS